MKPTFARIAFARTAFALAVAAFLLSPLPVSAQGRAPRGQASPQFDQLTMMTFEKQLQQDGVRQMIPSRNAEKLIARRVDPPQPRGNRGQAGMVSVVVAFEIAKDGRVRHATAVSGPKSLQPAAVAAVQQWLFKPFVHNGQAVPVGTSITLRVATP
jgi:TonB family protein